MTEGLPRQEREENREEALTEGEYTPKEWHEKLRKLIENIPT